jgi:hypothetical protein
MVEVATRVLIAGGGVAALEAALALRELGELSAMPDESWAAAEDRELQGCHPVDVGPVSAVPFFKLGLGLLTF